MIKIVLLILFLLGSIHNFNISRENYVYVSKKSIFTMILIMFGVVSFYICYKLDNTILGYSIVISALIYVISFTFTPGIGKDGVNIMMGTTTLIKGSLSNNVDEESLKKLCGGIRHMFCVGSAVFFYFISIS